MLLKTTIDLDIFLFKRLRLKNCEKRCFYSLYIFFSLKSYYRCLLIFITYIYQIFISYLFRKFKTRDISCIITKLYFFNNYYLDKDDNNSNFEQAVLNKKSNVTE